MKYVSLHICLQTLATLIDILAWWSMTNRYLSHTLWLLLCTKRKHSRYSYDWNSERTNGITINDCRVTRIN